MIHTFATDINFLHKGEEKLTYLCHLSIYVLLFIWLDKFESPWILVLHHNSNLVPRFIFHLDKLVSPKYQSYGVDPP
jgi:hypothetical protein